jgi:hypothetical protein
MIRIACLAVLALCLVAASPARADLDRVPAPAGSDVIHHANKIHYDGAKDEETIIQVWGMGPATSTPVGPR